MKVAVSRFKQSRFSKETEVDKEGTFPKRIWEQNKKLTETSILPVTNAQGIKANAVEYNAIKSTA